MTEEQLEKEESFSWTSLLPVNFSEALTGEVELIKEGVWKHPDAPNGEIHVTEKRIDDWIRNFQQAICGSELPLDFDHKLDSKETPGWISDLKKRKNGVCSLWASLRFTDPETAEKIKNGSLRFISARIIPSYPDTSTGKRYDVIRNAALTNYPHLKGLQPISVNLSEIINPEEEDISIKENTMPEKILDELETFNFEATEDDSTDLADKVGYGYAPPADIKGCWAFYIGKVPKGHTFLSKEVELKDGGEKGKWAFYPDMAEAPGSPVKSQAKAPMKFSEQPPISASEKGLLAKLASIFGDDATPKGKNPAEAIKLELAELRIFKDQAKKDQEAVELKLAELKNFKEKMDKAETQRILASYPKLTPAVKTILSGFLEDKSTEIQLGEEKKSIRTATLSLLEELAASPTINLFETLVSTKPIEKDADNHTKISLYLTEHPDLSYRTAMIEMAKIGLL